MKIVNKWENERFTCNTLKCIEISSRSIKVKGNHYPGDDPEIVAGDRLTPAQEKLAYCEVMMAGRWLWHHICKKEKGYI
jgi:hypothetical protein